MTDLVLDDFELDLNCYKVRLGLALLDVDYAKNPVDYYPAKADSVTEVPILRHGGREVHGAENALLYLATECAPHTSWVPAGSAENDRLMGWLGFSAATFGAVTSARDLAMFSTDPIDEAVDRAAAAVQKLDDHLAVQRIDNHWVVGRSPSIADIALFAGAALTRDIGIDRGHYPALRWWLRRVQSLPGFIAMPGIPVFP